MTYEAKNIYTVLSIYNSARGLNIRFVFNRNRCRPSGSNQTILWQRTSITMMLQRCQASVRCLRREGEQTI